MVTKNISHTVTRAGRTLQHDPISIHVASDLITAPGVVKKENDVSFYSRNYPLESLTIVKPADRVWTWAVFSDEVAIYLQHQLATT